ncbi:GAF domain-containing protein [Skermanella mucosa]|uniref:sensor histidine kinase n=1 Tax=Skermanella mucosa TaxID=1789672 RepID=UPI00192C19F1|nr:histidine kinase dimerization/phosphoacceptor domain -containing protein [Skermanella mucosa]UEM22230.1 GAF domain-containing protein [Skermanella mucosa]
MSDDTFDHERWIRRQSALAEFGRQALMVDDLDALLHEAVVLAAQGLRVKRAKVMERLPGGEQLLMRAGVGWRPGLEGTLVVDAGSRSSGGYTLKSGKPVIADDIEAESRFDVPRFLRDHGIRSLINVIIQGRGEAFGVLEVDSDELRSFNQEDVDFLQSYANILAAAIERRSSNEALARLAEERAVLLRELQHRVKNNLQIITSLLNMQIRRVGGGEVESQLRIIGSRVETLRVVHDSLFEAESVERIGLSRYLRTLCESLLAFHGARGEDVTLDFAADDAEAGVDTTVPLGLLINEFIVNSLQHAFSAAGQEGGGRIALRLDRTAPDSARLTLSDDGPGFDRVKASRVGTGLQIMDVLANQLGGKLAWDNDAWRKNEGARLTLDLPVL